MASYSATTPTSLADELVCIVNVGSTSEDNVTGSTAGKIYLCSVDNTSNPDIAVYLNLVDASSATAGTTIPDFRIHIPRGKKSTISWSDGHSYSSGVCLWVTTSSATSSQESVSSNVLVKLLVTA